MTHKKFKIRYKRLIVFLIILIVVILAVLKLFNLKITNIYVSGNNFLSDQDIIELAGVENYPGAIMTFSKTVESKVNSSVYVSSINVKKKFTILHIDITENRPLFYDEINKRTVLMDGNFTQDNFNIPSLVTGIDSLVYENFLKCFSLIDEDVFNNISEISYVPNDVDKELFLFTMNDGNYIYVSLDKFESVNKYFDMVVKFNNHKGILYLDSGEYFKILDN